MSIISLCAPAAHDEQRIKIRNHILSTDLFNGGIYAARNEEIFEGVCFWGANLFSMKDSQWIGSVLTNPDAAKTWCQNTGRELREQKLFGDDIIPVVISDVRFDASVYQWNQQQRHQLEKGTLDIYNLNRLFSKDTFVFVWPDFTLPSLMRDVSNDQKQLGKFVGHDAYDQLGHCIWEDVSIIAAEQVKKTKESTAFYDRHITQHALAGMSFNGLRQHCAGLTGLGDWTAQLRASTLIHSFIGLGAELLSWREQKEGWKRQRLMSPSLLKEAAVWGELASNSLLSVVQMREKVPQKPLVLDDLRVLLPLKSMMGDQLRALPEVLESCGFGWGRSPAVQATLSLV